MHENSNVEKSLQIPKIIKVLYSPSKVFRELSEKMSYKGVILVLILIIASNIFVGYTFSMKQYIRKVKPNLLLGQSDIWTENATLWNSNGNCVESDDKIYGEYSINCTIINETEVYIQMTLPEETINCSAYEFNQTNFSLKLSSSTDPACISLILFSANTGRFILDLKEKVREIKKWNNISVSLGEKEDEWINKENASWHAINGVGLLVEFPEKVNASLLLDALIFQGQYESRVNYFITDAILISIRYFMFSILFWIIFGGLLYFLIKYSGSSLRIKGNLIISGYSLTTFFVQAVFHAILALFLLPRIYYQVDVPTKSYIPTQLPTAAELIFSVLFYSQFVFLAWGIVISIFAVRTLGNLTISKSTIISLASYLTAFFLAGLLS